MFEFTEKPKEPEPVVEPEPAEVVETVPEPVMEPPVFVEVYQDTVSLGALLYSCEMSFPKPWLVAL